MTKRQYEKLCQPKLVKSAKQAFIDLNEIFDKGPNYKNHNWISEKVNGVEPYDTPRQLRNWAFDKRAPNV